MIRSIVRRPVRPWGLLALSLALSVLAGCGGHAPRARVSRQRTIPTPTETTPTAGPLEPERTVGEFGRIGTGAGELQEAFGIAINHRSGDVYVVDTDHVRIERFTSAGKFLLAWGWGVADGKTRALQTCTRKCYSGFTGAGAGQFSFPEGVAIDNNPSSASYGDVYVVDIANSRVEKFDPRGRFLLTFGRSVNQTARKRHNHSNEDICPVSPGDICGKGAEGSTGGQLEFVVEGTFIAIARDDTVYLGQRNRVTRFSPKGRYLSELKLSPKSTTEGREAGGVSALTITAEGDLYVVRHGIVGLNEYAPSGRLLRTLEPGGDPAYPEGPTPSMALDPAGNLYVDVYAQYQHRIDEFSSSGVKLATFDRGRKAEPGIADKEDGLPGMAYSPRTKKLYLVNADVNVTPRVERVRIVAPPPP